MGASGILRLDDRVELIEGQVFVLSPIGSRHAACVNRLSEHLIANLRGKAIVHIQNPVHLGRYSEPEPDISVLRYREDYYEAHHPRPEDVLVLIEVADSTEASDRLVKVPLYARHGIREVWLVLVEQQTVEVYRQPQENTYGEVTRYGYEATWDAQQLRNFSISGRDVWGRFQVG